MQSFDKMASEDFGSRIEAMHKPKPHTLEILSDNSASSEVKPVLAI